MTNQTEPTATTFGVTGANGTLGKQIVHHLAERGRVGRIITRSPMEIANADGWDVRRGDYDDPAGLADAFSGLDRVFVMSTPDEPEVRIRRHRNAIDAARAAGVREVLFLSLHDAVPDSPFAFAAANHDAEEHLRLAGVDWMVLAPNVYAEAIAAQAGESIHRDRLLDMPFGDGRAGWITRDDIARTVAAAMDDRFVAQGHFAITGPASMGAADIARSLTQQMGTEIRYEPLTLDEYRSRLEAAGFPPVTAAAFTGLCEAIADQRFDLVTTTVQDFTGNVPTALDEVLRDAFAVS